MKVADWSGLEHRGHVQKIGGEGVTCLVPTVNVPVTKTSSVKNVPMIVISNLGSFVLVTSFIIFHCCYRSNLYQLQSSTALVSEGRS